MHTAEQLLLMRKIVQNFKHLRKYAGCYQQQPAGLLLLLLHPGLQA
jgi:hypothetical protein